MGLILAVFDGMAFCLNFPGIPVNFGFCRLFPMIPGFLFITLHSRLNARNEPLTVNMVHILKLRRDLLFIPFINIYLYG